MGNSEHEWKFTGCHPHNGEYWYQCLKCGATDWIAHYGTMDQLKPEKCEPAVEEVPEPLACHVCGSTSEQHFNGCGIAEFCPETGRPIPRETDPPAPAKSVGGIPPGWKLVPEEATQEMYGAARFVEEEGVAAMWEAMLAAAPAPPLPCHVCGTTSEIHAQFCSVEPPPLTKDEKNLLLHTLCALNHDKPSYRNRCFVYPSSDAHLVLERLEDRGFVEQTSGGGVHMLLGYRATAAGAAAVGKTLPKD